MFGIIVKGDIDKTIQEVKNKVVHNGGSFMRNQNKGKIEVKGVEIEFTIEGNEVYIEIIDRPWLVSDDYVEEKIREYFN